MACNDNRLPRPAVVLISEGNANIIVERESYAHLLEREIIPYHLDKIQDADCDVALTKLE